MAGCTSRASSLQWALVIDAVINVKDIDVITLIKLFTRTSKISCDVDRKAKEIISLKILEQLFDPDNRPIKSALCAKNSGVSCDFSERCEDVLRDILGKMNDPNVWDESEKSKWNLKRFIEYKRRIMDMHMEGKTSYLTSLNKLVTSRKINQDGTKNRDVNGAVIDNKQKRPFIDDNVCQDTSNGRSKRTRIGDLRDKACHEISNERNKRTRIGDLCDENGDIDTSNEGNISTRNGSFSDDECYQKELDDINAKKQKFFRSNCKDKKGSTHQKNVTRCMKCRKGGQLLICSSKACSFVFHERCLVSSTPFDYDSSGNFFCHFCKCSQSISDFWVAKKKTSLARIHLANFCKKDNKNIESRIPNAVLDPDLNNKIAEKDGEKERAVQKPTKSFTDLFFPQRRRVPVPWTQSEEETLEKWVEKFMSCNNIQERGFPWSKILELGASTFQKSRISVDLKDKWRNMQKARKKSA